MLLNTASGGIDIFEAKLTFEMLTVCGQQHSFSTHEKMYKEFVLRGTLTQGFAVP